MTATNHVLTGTLIGLSVHQPGLALVLAVLSHFVLDALPHYGADKHTSNSFLRYLSLDATCALLVLFALVIVQPEYWLLAIACGIAAASPDLMWMPLWVRELQGKPKKPFNFVMRFHEKIQWAEKSYNYPYEVIWFFVCLFILVKLT